MNFGLDGKDCWFGPGDFSTRCSVLASFNGSSLFKCDTICQNMEKVYHFKNENAFQISFLFMTLIKFNDEQSKTL